MGLYNIINRTEMAQGQSQDISDVVANFDAIAAILNGHVSPTNLEPSVTNGQWLKTAGGAVLWAGMTDADVSGIVAVGAAINAGAGNTDTAWDSGSASGVYRAITTGGGSLRSFGAPTKGGGTRLTMRNNTANAVTILHNTGGGTGAVFALIGGVNIVLGSGDAAEFVYDGATWVQVGIERNPVLFDSGYLTGVAASIDTSQFSTLFTHLRIVTLLRGDNASANTTARLQFNLDAGANYDDQNHAASAAAAAIAESLGQTQWAFSTIPANTATAAKAAVGRLYVPYYSGTTYHKVVQALTAHVQGNATTNLVVGNREGVWRSAAAINRIVFTPAAGNFAIGSRIIVYGEN